MKEQGKIKAGELNKTSNMLDREFKVMVIKIFTGLQKGGKDLSKILNKEIENKTKEPSRN